MMSYEALREAFLSSREKKTTTPNDDIVKQTHASTQLIPHAFLFKHKLVFSHQEPRISVHVH